MKSKMTRLAVLATLACCQNAFSLEEQALFELLEDARTEMRLPGVRAAVRFRDGTIVRAAAGLADKKHGIPLNNEVGMPGGSTGKPFVAALTMLLVEDGVLSLDDPVSMWLGDEDWFNDLPNRKEMLVRHLLSHSSGIGDYPGKMRFRFGMVSRVLRHGSAYFTPEELIALAGRKARFPAGEGFAYSDSGYLVLGRVIEAATDQSFYDLLHEKIISPLRLSQVQPQIHSALPNITPGYQGGVSNLQDDGRMKLDPRSEWTGGGLVTNPTMLVNFFAALAEGRVVSQQSLEQMLKAGWRDPNGPGHHYGLGLFVDDHGNWFGHGGMWVGYRTHVTHFVPRGMTIAIQTNRDGRVDMIGLLTRIATLAAKNSAIAE